MCSHISRYNDKKKQEYINNIQNIQSFNYINKTW